MIGLDAVERLLGSVHMESTNSYRKHFPALMAHQDDSSLIELTELLAIVSGVFMLRGQNWARWLALVWMAFHVAISFPVYRQMATHLAMFVGISWVLFMPDTRRYFAIRKPGNQ